MGYSFEIHIRLQRLARFEMIKPKPTRTRNKQAQHEPKILFKIISLPDPNRKYIYLLINIFNKTTKTQ